MEDLPADEEEGPGDPLTLPSQESGIQRKFTLLGVGVGVIGTFTVTLS